LRADDASFRPGMGTRGAAAAATGTATTGAGSSARGVTTVAVSASETPSRCARAVRERAGHHRGGVVRLAVRARGHASIDGLCSAPYRTSALAPPGGQKSSGRCAGRTAALPASAGGSSYSYTPGDCGPLRYGPPERWWRCWGCSSRRSTRWRMPGPWRRVLARRRLTGGREPAHARGTGSQATPRRLGGAAGLAAVTPGAARQGWPHPSHRGKTDVRLDPSHAHCGW
jgi:hypothetical protein